MSAVRKRLLAQIHIGKKQLGLDDDTYRSLLRGVTGKDSCRGLHMAELHKVVHALKQRGFKSQRKLPKRKPNQAPTRVNKLQAIWLTMGQLGYINDISDAALLRWVQGQLHKRQSPPIDALQWLDSHQDCNLILEQLKQWRTRCATQALNADLKAVSDATAAFEQQGKSLTQAQVTQALLDHGVITWHELFNSLGLTPLEHYCGSRKELRPLSAVLGERACS